MTLDPIKNGVVNGNLNHFQQFAATFRSLNCNKELARLLTSEFEKKTLKDHPAGRNWN